MNDTSDHAKNVTLLKKPSNNSQVQFKNTPQEQQ
jgi:hypothetical protein